jgi:hypothetical protein
MLTRLRPFLLALLAVEACSDTRPSWQQGDVIRQMQRRDDILGLLLPFLAAGLLLLVLVAMRQHRSGKPAFGWLSSWWNERKAARLQRASSPEPGPQSEAAFAGMVESGAEEVARHERKIRSGNGRVLLRVDQRVRVHTPDGVREGPLYDVGEQGLVVQTSRLVGHFDIPWEDVQRVDAQYGPPRQQRVSWMFALLGAGFFGYCGAILDSIDRATAVIPKPQYTTALGTILGALVGFLLGRLVMYALPGPVWRQLVVRTDGSPALSPANFATRASASSAATGGIESTPRAAIVARAILVLIVFGLCALFQ